MLPFFEFLSRAKMNFQSANKTDVKCQICFDEIDQDDPNFPYLTTGTCDHYVCPDCLRAYFKNALKDDRHTCYDLIECSKPACKQHYSSYKVLEHFFSAIEIADWWDDALSSKAYITNKVTLMI